jgi:ELWxxDGT repeat protein
MRMRCNIRLACLAVTIATVSVLFAAALAPAAPPNDALLVKDINPGTVSSLPNSLTVFNGALFFIADDGGGSADVWRTDGTAAGTTKLDVAGTGSSASQLTPVNGTLFFTNNDGTNGFELWRSDGTMAGTTMVKNINPGAASSNPGTLIDVGGTLFFRANDGTNGAELWKSDGTAAGTTMVKDINPGAPSSAPGISPVGPYSAVLNGILYFNANDGTNGLELWRSDGSVAGTTLVKDINPAAGAGSDTASLTRIGGFLYLTATDGTTGTELWRSDGTGPGTIRAKDINPGPGSSFPQALTALGGTGYFTADDGVHGRELWRSDGTDPGTSIVKDINPTAGAVQGFLGVAGSSLYFGANDGALGSELWRSDGSAAGTTMVKDINPGTPASNPGSFSDLNGELIFGADDGVAGTEVWKSDGTAAGTSLVKDVNPGATGSGGPALGTVFDNDLYFRALTAGAGAELWHTVDTIAPDTTITSGPGEGSPTKDATPKFGFASSDPPSTFECRFDAGAFGACSGPGATHKPASKLGDGRHQFEVRATDAGGNLDPTPATRAFVVDTKLMGAKLRVKRKQGQRRSIRVKAKAGADEAVTIKAKATVRVGGGKGHGRASSKPVKLKAKPTRAAAGKLAGVTLKASRSDSRRLLAKLGSGGTKAKLKVTLADAAGNRTTLKATVLLVAG